MSDLFFACLISLLSFSRSVPRPYVCAPQNQTQLYSKECVI